MSKNLEELGRRSVSEQSFEPLKFFAVSPAALLQFIVALYSIIQSASNCIERGENRALDERKSTNSSSGFISFRFSRDRSAPLKSGKRKRELNPYVKICDRNGIYNTNVILGINCFQAFKIYRCFRYVSIIKY